MLLLPLFIISAAAAVTAADTTAGATTTTTNTTIGGAVLGCERLKQRNAVTGMDDTLQEPPSRKLLPKHPQYPRKSSPNQVLGQIQLIKKGCF